MSHIRSTYLATADAVVELLGKPEVVDAWEDVSVLPAFRVSGLAGHLARSIFQVDDYLDSLVAGTPPITAAVYFAELEGTDGHRLAAQHVRPPARPRGRQARARRAGGECVRSTFHATRQAGGPTRGSADPGVSQSSAAP